MTNMRQTQYTSSRPFLISAYEKKVIIMTKDFLFLDYSYTPNSTYYFKSFEKMGHSIDIVTEKTLPFYTPSCDYKNVVVYLHEQWTIPYTERLLNYAFPNCVLIQHDDTDWEDVYFWTSRKPDLVMHREYTENTKCHPDVPIGTFHFPIESWFDPSIQTKEYDVCFLGNMTNPRRVKFADTIMNLMSGRLSHLKWKVTIQPHVNTPSNLYNNNIFLQSGEKVTGEAFVEGVFRGETSKTIVNKTKIGLNDFGNSYEQFRHWEYASSGIAILCPKLRTKCLTDPKYQPFNEYLAFSDDYSDLGDKIEYLLENERYKEYAQAAKNAYDTMHTPEKCFEMYYAQVMKYARI